MSWQSIHVYHHDATGIDALLRGAIEPVLRQSPGGFFVRHWLRGPHIRINVPSGASVLPLVQDIVGSYLHERPSPPVDERTFVREHELLARLEQEDGPLFPWEPNNSIAVRPYNPRTHVLGTPAASELLAQFYVETTPLIFEILRADVRSVALDLMWATAHATSIPFTPLDPPITRGFISFRSHADQVITRATDPDTMRARFDHSYTRLAPALADRLNAVVSTVDGHGDVPFVAQWAWYMRRFQRLAAELIDQGTLALTHEAPQLPAREVTTFQAHILGSTRFRNWMRDDPWFLSYRLVLNYLYLNLTRLGLPPVERARLCHLAARTVEDVHNVSATELVSRFA